MRGDKRKRGLEFSAEAKGREPSGKPTWRDVWLGNPGATGLPGHVRVRRHMPTQTAAWACHPRACFFCGKRSIRPNTGGRESSPNCVLPRGADLPMIPWE